MSQPSLGAAEVAAVQAGLGISRSASTGYRRPSTLELHAHANSPKRAISEKDEVSLHRTANEQPALGIEQYKVVSPKGRR
jgi:hypothetical protein